LPDRLVKSERHNVPEIPSTLLLRLDTEKGSKDT
jgi:hypothetical protein